MTCTWNVQRDSSQGFKHPEGITTLVPHKLIWHLLRKILIIWGTDSPAGNDRQIIEMSRILRDIVVGLISYIYPDLKMNQSQAGNKWLSLCQVCDLYLWKIVCGCHHLPHVLLINTFTPVLLLNYFAASFFSSISQISLENLANVYFANVSNCYNNLTFKVSNLCL